MKVLVVGSIHYENAEAQRANFVKACQELGAALAKAGHEVVVGGESPNTADRHVVDGIVATADRPVRVRVMRPEAEAEAKPVPFKDVAGGKVMFRYETLKGAWTAGRVPQILAADAVVLIGGGPGTTQTAYAAIPLERPVVPIPAFGGAAKEVWDVVDRFYDRLGEKPRDEIRQLKAGGWQGPASAALVVDALRTLTKEGVFRRPGSRLPVVLAVAVTLGLIAGWVALLVGRPNPPLVAYFGMLLLAALLGIVLRNAYTAFTGDAGSPTFRTVGLQVVVGLILAFALTVLYLIGGFTVTGDAGFVFPPDDKPVKPADWTRNALALTVLGFLAGWLIELVYDRLKAVLAERVQKTL